MKMVTIALLLFMIQASASIVNAMGLLQYGITTDDTSFDNAKRQIESQQYFQSSAQTDTSVSFGFGDFVKGLGMLVDAVVGIIIIPYLMHQFGMPISYAILFSIPLYLIYVLGYAQFVANRSLKVMT